MLDNSIYCKEYSLFDPGDADLNLKKVRWTKTFYIQRLIILYYYNKLTLLRTSKLLITLLLDNNNDIYSEKIEKIYLYYYVYIFAE